MNTYTTSEIATCVGIHPNTVRLYEKLKLISTPTRKENGYRIYTDLHLEQVKLVRAAFQIEVLQNGLRKQAIAIVKSSAIGNFDHALELTTLYLQQIKKEQSNAEEAIAITENLMLNGNQETDHKLLTRKETADHLQISMDSLRNWEMNGLLTIKRKKNGYRVYTSNDLKQLKIIRSLRQANYSLASILRMLNTLSHNPQANIQQVIDTPNECDNIISVCDQLLTSLHHAEQNAYEMFTLLNNMKQQNLINPPL